MSTESLVKKLNVKDQSKPFLVLNAPKAFDELRGEFTAVLHSEPEADHTYPFVMAFGATMEELKGVAGRAASAVEPGGLLWLCYPKKSSKLYKGSDCSRESVAPMLAGEGYEPVRQIAIDEDWSALRFKPAGDIKTMTRKFAVTEAGKARTGQQ